MDTQSIDYTSKYKMALRLASQISDDLVARGLMTPDQGQLLFCRLTDAFVDQCSVEDIIELAFRPTPAERGVALVK